MIAVKAPRHGWDMVAYIGAVKYLDDRDPQVVHRYAYEELKRGVPQADYVRLVTDQPTPDLRVLGDSTYRSTMSENPKAFLEQLSYYQIRPLYVTPIYLLTKVGIGPVRAAHVVAGIAVAIGMVVLYFVCSAILPPALVLLAGLLSVIVGIPFLARLASPDGLSFCMLMILTFFIVRGRWTALLVAMPVAIAVRTDLVLFTFPLYLLLAFKRDTHKRSLGISFAASVMTYVAVNAIWSNPGWATTFYHSFIERQLHPVSAPPTLKLSDYFEVLVQHGLLSAHWINRVVLIYLVMVSASILVLWQRRKAVGLRDAITSPAAVLALAAAGYVAGHFIIFPVLWERYFAGAYTVAMVALLWLITQYLGSRAGVSAPSAAKREFSNEVAHA